MHAGPQDHTATLDYQTTYFCELNPARLQLMLANQRLRARGAVLHACELGYGTGLSSVIHAAASNIHWWGTDYNPAHAQWAHDLAGQGGVSVNLVDQSFQDFCQRGDLPDFDFIALHGVWSWVSDANRAVIVDFLRRKLRVGGVVYLSYNTLPGHAQMVPVRNLMKAYMDNMTHTGQDDVQRAQLAYQFVKSLMDSNPQLAEVFPLAKRSMDDLQNHSSNSYINHEYLVQHWTPMSFCDVFSHLQDAKLRFACSALPTHHDDAHFLVPAQRDVLAGISDFCTRETTRDFLINRQFRQDYWIKGGLNLSASHARETLIGCRVVLVRPAVAVMANVVQAVFHTNIPEATHNTLKALLADGLPHPVAEVLAQAIHQGQTEASALHGILSLLGNGSLAVAQDEATIGSVGERVLRLNAAICQQAHFSGDITHLASAVTGGGIRVGQLHMQFLAYRFDGLEHPQDWSNALALRLQASGVRLFQDGAPITSLGDCVAHIGALAHDFERLELPLLQRLQCVP